MVHDAVTYLTAMRRSSRDANRSARTGRRSHSGLSFPRNRLTVGRQQTSGRIAMTAFNAVRFRVKAGRDQEFLDAHKNIRADWPGLRHVNIIKTGDGTYCIIAEWDDMNALANARPNMIATLDTFRHMLEDLGGSLGVTDPVSGPVVLELK